MRAACKIAPYAIAGGCCHCYSIHRIWKRRQSICGQAAPPDLLRWNKRSAAIVLNNITRQTQIGHERKLLWCASSDYNSASTFLACSTHVFICALHPIHTHFLPLRSDRLPNWTPLDRSSTSNPWRRRFFVLSVEFLRLTKFMCVSACCIIIHSRIFFHVFVFVFELSFVACVFAPFPSNKRRRNNNFETKKNKKKKNNHTTHQHQRTNESNCRAFRLFMVFVVGVVFAIRNDARRSRTFPLRHRTMSAKHRSNGMDEQVRCAAAATIEKRYFQHVTNWFAIVQF